MPPIPVSKTKIVPPRRRAELLTRQRLLDLLFDALDRKLTLISAPAGYGKTSLLIDLAHNSEFPCCWLTLDELDREPQRFAAYFIAALAERFPKFGSQSKGVLDGMVSFEQDMERLLVTLVNELYEQVQEYFIFVLDDFHLLEGAAPIQNFVNRFVQLVDDNCHLVISSRILTSLSDLPLLVAREQVSGLNFADLAFQPHELQALLAQNNNGHISDEEAARLIEEAEGWITGLQFSDGNVLRSSAHTIMRDSAGLFEYFDQQVLDRQPPDLREFILRTSLLEEFDASLCETVLAPLYPEPQDWEQRIKLIARNNLFALPVGEDGRWLRYHHLFRDFIRHRFERERTGEIKPILSRLQQAYESMGEWEKAHHICRQLDDPAALAEIIERAGTSMLQSAHLTMESWLNELPPSLLRTRPGLLSIRGAITYTKGDLHGGLELLNEAEKLFRSENDVYGLALTLSRRATGHRFLGDYEKALLDVDELIRLSEDEDDLRILYSEALRIKGLVLYRLGQARRSVEFFEKSLNLYIRLNDSASIPRLLMETGMAYRATGDFEAARNAYEKALEIWRREGNLFWQASLLNNMGGLFHGQGEYEKAALTFEEGLLCAQRSHYARLDGLISIGLGDLYAELEDFEMAQQNYRHAADVLRGMDDRFLHNSLALAQANLALLQRDSALARALIVQAADSILSSNSNYEHGLLDFIHGRLALFEGEPHKAVEELANAEKHFVEDGREIEAAASRVWRAAACHQDGNREGALHILHELTANRKKNAHILLTAVHQSRGWLNGLQTNSAGARAVRDLFSQADRLANRIPAIRRQLRRQARAVPAPAPRLVIQAFGNAAVSVEGRLLSPSDWQTQSVRDLFFYFLSEAKPLTKEQIGEILWPGFYDSAKLKLRFKNEIYRLRRAVGQDAILFKDALYSFNRSLDYEYDVEAFEACLVRAKEMANPVEQIELYQKAVDLVAGPYLNDIYADWTIHDRERLSQAFLAALVSLGDLCQKHAQPERALAVSRRAVEYDPVFEPAYRLAMQIYSRLNDRAAIRRTYEACVEALKKRLDMPPSEETEELYRRLTK
jgi:ATP/maltotriose-dependent transcriptional regulator MalT